MTGESEFVALTDKILISIGAALDLAADTSDVDIDWALNDGILTIDRAASPLDIIKASEIEDVLESRKEIEE